MAKGNPREKIGDTQSTNRWLKEQGQKDREGADALRKSGGTDLTRAKRTKKEQDAAELASYKLRNRKF